MSHHPTEKRTFFAGMASKKKDGPVSSIPAGLTRQLIQLKGSLYKLCYKELIVFLLSFGIVSVVYHHGLDSNQKRIFEKAVGYAKLYMGLISLPFLLGFYITVVANRWWQQYLAIPWPDRLILCLQMYLPGNDEQSTLLRSVLMRRCLLMLVLLLRTVAIGIKRRFPSYQDVVNYGLMTETELRHLESISSDINLFWVPGNWFVHALHEAKKRRILDDPNGAKLIMEEFLSFRSKCGMLWSFNWVTIPLVYTQVVTLATYTFFAASVLGRQHIESQMSTYLAVDVYFPLSTVLEFLFYFGLLKVAEQMKNPYGDDDEDFDLNFLIERHVKVITLTAGMAANSPPLGEDFTPVQKISTIA